MNDINSNINILTRPDGSAIFSQGKTTVIAGIYGPVECRPNKMLIDKANIEIHFRPKSGLPSVTDRFYEATLKEVCEVALRVSLYPRMAFVIVVQELERGNELIAASVNAACLALLDSGSEMKFAVAATTCCLDENGELHSDCTNVEQENAKATFIFVFDSVAGDIIASHTTGSFTIDQYEKAITLCKLNSGKVFAYYREVLGSQCFDDEGDDIENEQE